MNKHNKVYQVIYTGSCFERVEEEEEARQELLITLNDHR